MSQRNRDIERRRPETKTFLATSEFWITAGGIVGIFFGAYALDDITDGTAWRLATYVAIAYIVSRGIAKAGSQRDFDERPRELTVRRDDLDLREPALRTSDLGPEYGSDPTYSRRAE